MPNVEVQGFRLSSQQERLWSVMDASGAEAFCSMAVARLRSDVSLEALDGELSRLVADNETFRTKISRIPGMDIPLQVVTEADFPGTEERDLREMADETRGAEIARIVRDCKEASRPGNRDCALSSFVARLPSGESRLYLAAPAICADATSMALLMDRLRSSLSGIGGAQEGLQYVDYAEWERELLASPDMESGRTFWRKRREPLLRQGRLPFERAAGAPATFEMDQVPVAFSTATMGRLIQFLDTEGLDEETFLLGLWVVLLWKHLQQDAFALGVSKECRKVDELKSSFGAMAKALPLFFEANPAMNFADTCRAVGKQMAEMVDYQEAFAWRSLEPEEGTGSPILLKRLFEYRRFDAGRVDAEAALLSVESILEPCDLAFACSRIGPDLACALRYSRSSFSRDAAETFAQQLECLAESVLANPERAIRGLSALGAEARRRAVAYDVEERRDDGGAEFVGDWVARHAAAQPDGLAAKARDGSLAWAALNERANQLAHWLVAEREVGPGSIVAVVVEPTVASLVSIVAILKAGAAYLPIDASAPLTRIDSLARSAGSALILNASGAELSGLAVAVVLVASLSLESQPASDLPRRAGATDLAYVIFTSGSTGAPKGVGVERRHLCHYLRAVGARLELEPGMSFASVTSLATDLGHTSVFSALRLGGALHLIDPDASRDVHAFAAYMRNEGIECVKATPGLFNELARGGNPEIFPKRRLILGGERLDWGLIDRIKAQEPTCRVFNHYGPTETTVGAICGEVALDAADRVGLSAPLGKPLANSAIRILDADGEPAADGMCGEICISGLSVARGYVNGDSDRFQADPFAAAARMYRTGDVGRRLSDGSIEFVGRNDDQVKVRGHRVELGEVQSALANVVGVSAAVARASDSGGGDLRIVAYYVGEIEEAALLSELARCLPGYMIPSSCVRLDSLPLKANGKIDASRLPKPSELWTRAPYVEPSAGAERRLAEIWRDLLGQERIGARDRFFEIGGHSLKAMRLVARIEQEFSARVPLADVFQYPELRALAARIDAAGSAKDWEIPPVAKRPRYPASSQQSRLFALQEMDSGGTAYNTPVAVAVAAGVDPDSIERAIRAVIAKREPLRTRFEVVDGEVAQIVEDAAEFALERLEAGEDVDALADSFVRPFDLSRAPLLRAGYAPRRDGGFLLIDMHHIVTDRASNEILVREFARALEGEPLGEPATQYKDFAVWQREGAGREALRRQGAFWAKRLGGELPTLDFPTDFPRPKMIDPRGSRLRRALDGSRAAALKNFCNARGVTLYAAMLAAFKVVAAKYAGRDELVVGAPVSGRDGFGMNEAIGMFVNMLPIVSAPAPGKRFADYLDELSETVREALANQQYPFEQMVEDSAAARDMSRNPLFDFAFGLQEGKAFEGGSVGRDFAQLDLKRCSSKFDLFLKVFDVEGQISFEIEYRADLFRPETIETFASRFERILSLVTRAPDLPIGELKLLSSVEEQAVRARFSNEGADGSADAFEPIVRRVERFARSQPAAIAVADRDGALSYRALNERANRLARYLKSVLPDGERGIVGVALGTSVDGLVAILGVLKTGCAYLPIDPKTPLPRALECIRNASARVVLVDRSLDRAPFQDARARAAGFDEIPWETLSPEDLDVAIAAEDLAYVIFTSGSTGAPKGVCVEHGNLDSYLQAARARMGLDACRSFAAVSSLATDLGNTTVFSALMLGATLRVFSYEEARDPQLLSEGFGRASVDCLKIAPSHLAELLRTSFAASLLPEKRLILGGETLDWTLLKRIEELGARCEVYNHYGPTETTVGAVCGKVDSAQQRESGSRSAPIGWPLDNAVVYIRDAAGNVSPPGVVGELWIGGGGVARGYLNDEAGDRFVENAISGRGRLYRTGDYARWLADGRIEFLGRRDRQVKIRGHRVELDEVESIAKRIDGVQAAYAMAVDSDAGDKASILYYVGEIDEPRVAAGFESRAPWHMRPDRCVRLPEFPLTLNGKIDRRRLPTIASTGGEVAPTEAATEVEAKLIGIWKEMLALPSVRLGDNFFNIGGHSLRAIRMMTRVRETFGVHVPLTGFFANPTLRALAQSIERSASPDERRVPKVEPRASYPASSQQKRLYALQQFAPESVAYNMPTAHWLRGDVDLGRLQEAIDQIVRLHAILRTRFEAKGGRLSQIVEDAARVEIELEEVAELDAEERVAAFVRPFDLQRAPLLRVRVARAPGTESLLLTDMHHIASDGSSRALLVENLYRALQGESLPAPEAQYADYALWQQEGAGRALIEAQKRFWQEQFAESVPALELPTDFERPRVRSYRGSTYAFELAPETTQALAAYCESKGVTLYMALLAIQGVLLAKHSGQEDIAIGTPSTGRDLGGVEKTLGMFINTLAMRVRPYGEKRFGDYLEEVRRFCSEAFDHQQYPFEDLVESIRLERDLSRNPIFDTMLVVQNYDRNASLEDCGVARKASFESSVSKMDLTLFAREDNGVLSLAFEYATDLFLRDTIVRLANRFATLVQQVLESDDATIDALSVMDDAERAQLCRGFNDTEFPIPANGGIAALFEAQVARRPDAPALTFEGRTLTYGELNARANRLAWRLMDTGCGGPEKIVAVAMERSFEQFASILATLKTGAAYLPIDPALPAERVRIMIEESRACVALHRGRPLEGFAGPQIDASDADAKSARSENPGVAVAPQSLAYAIFTSGSTGRPKGVLVEQGNVVNFIASIAARLELDSRDRILCATTIGFDIFVLESLAPLAVGMSVALANAEEAIDPARLLELVERERPTVVQFTPSRMRMLLASARFEESMAAVGKILLGGESLPGAMLNELQGRTGARLFNLYGPTETTVWSTASELTESPSVHVGKPIGNTVVRVLDGRQRLAPIGVKGELWIGGAGVARGYLGDEALTRSRFIPDPYDARARLYRAGDIARWTAEGDLECFGRLDDQVKVRGHRIELGEIESALASHAAVGAAAVVVESEAGGDPELIGYVALRGEASVMDLRRFLGERLPQYMIPGKFFALDALPLTQSGKIDRRRLGGSGRPLESGVEFEGARDDLERGLLEIWKQVLRVESVGARDNFFDLGGNSIRLLELQGAIERELDWRVRIVDLFRHPSIRALAESRNATKSDAPSDDSAERRVARKDVLASQRNRRLNARAN